MKAKALARSFGLVIRKLRLEAGLSQEDLADLCNLHRTYVGSIERGEKTVTIETANKLAQALNLTLSQLFIIMEDSPDTRSDDDNPTGI